MVMSFWHYFICISIIKRNDANESICKLNTHKMYGANYSVNTVFDT